MTVSIVKVSFIEYHVSFARHAQCREYFRFPESYYALVSVFVMTSGMLGVRYPDCSLLHIH